MEEWVQKTTINVWSGVLVSFVFRIMPYPCSDENLISNLVTDYIQKRRDQALLFSFEYNLLPNLISNFNHYMDRALVLTLCQSYFRISNTVKINNLELAFLKLQNIVENIIVCSVWNC